MSSILEVGDIIYKLRFETAFERVVIDKVTDYTAYSGELKLKRNYEGTKVQHISQNGLGRMGFGETFCIATPDMVSRLENDIKMKYIRNTDYSQFSHDEISDIQLFIKNIISFKEAVKKSAL